ncbi:MAG: hypothetical protein Q7J35_08530 [Candidatus Methanoperedens sp.]|nr:hypothetical protein [Candidatus Methanoperedens sp.]
MADKCPNCGETLITRTIQKKMGLGSIDFPVAQICQKCNWSKDLTGAGDIVVKPPSPEEIVAKREREVVRQAPEKPKYVPEKNAPEKTRPFTGASKQRGPDMNKIITIALALLVIAGIIWAFIPKGTEQPIGNQPVQSPAATPKITATAAATATAISGVTLTGNTIKVKINRDRGFINPNQKNLILKPGDEVIWVNDDIYSLTLVSKEGLFEDKLLGNNGKQISYIFNKTGTYNFDILVLGVKKFSGTVVVEP